MKIKILCFSAFFGFMVLRTAQSTCVWHCKERVNASFSQNPAVVGQPPSLSCIWYRDGRGGYLYTDNGNALTARKDRLVAYRKVDTCFEACWAVTSPFSGQEAVADPGDENLEFGLIMSYVCEENENVT